MKCEIPAGNRKCKHCLRRGIECSLLFARPARAIRFENNSTKSNASTAESYEHTISSLQQEIQQVRSALDVLVQRGASINFSPTDERRHGSLQQTLSFTPQSNTATNMLSEPSDNMQMAMTRENSMDPEHAEGCEQGQSGALTVEEPMSTLYEVTRLRNIRSNQAKTARNLPDGQSEVSDFITRGVISEREAQELYIT